MPRIALVEQRGRGGYRIMNVVTAVPRLDQCISLEDEHMNVFGCEVAASSHDRLANFRVLPPNRTSRVLPRR